MVRGTSALNEVSRDVVSRTPRSPRSVRSTYHVKRTTYHASQISAIDRIGIRGPKEGA